MDGDMHVGPLLLLNFDQNWDVSTILIKGTIFCIVMPYNSVKSANISEECTLPSSSRSKNKPSKIPAISSACHVILVGSCGLLSGPEDGGNTFLQNTGGLLLHYRVLQLRRSHFSKSPL
jgi:hypothetical protein